MNIQTIQIPTITTCDQCGARDWRAGTVRAIRHQDQAGSWIERQEYFQCGECGREGVRSKLTKSLS